MLTVMVTRMPGLGTGDGVMFEFDSAAATQDLLQAGGWTLLMAVNLMIFSLVHNPCSTTIVTIWKETRSARWTAVAALLPLGWLEIGVIALVDVVTLLDARQVEQPAQPVA